MLIEHSIQDIILDPFKEELIKSIIKRCNIVAPDKISATHTLEGTTLHVKIIIDTDNTTPKTVAQIIFLLGNLFGMTQVQLQLESPVAMSKDTAKQLVTELDKQVDERVEQVLSKKRHEPE